MSAETIALAYARRKIEQLGVDILTSSMAQLRALYRHYAPGHTDKDLNLEICRWKARLRTRQRREQLQVLEAQYAANQRCIDYLLVEINRLRHLHVPGF